MKGIEKTIQKPGYNKKSTEIGKSEQIKEIIGKINSGVDFDIHKLDNIFKVYLDIEEGINSEWNVYLNRESLNGLSNRRSEVEILAHILNIARKDAKKTDILYQANLSGRQIKNYMGFLINQGFLEENNNKPGAKIYRTTRRGDLFVQHWIRLISLIQFDNPMKQSNP